MYVNTGKSSKNFFYLYLIAGLVLFFDLFRYFDSGQTSKPYSIILLLLVLVFMAIQGPYIFEYDRTQTKLRLVNKSILFYYFGIFNHYLEIDIQQIKGFKIVNSFLRPRLFVQYQTEKNESKEIVFYLWSLNKAQRKDIKASMGRIILRTKNPEKNIFKDVAIY